jgi:hypothetical protein
MLGIATRGNDAAPPTLCVRISRLDGKGFTSVNTKKNEDDMVVLLVIGSAILYVELRCDYVGTGSRNPLVEA